MAEARHIDNVRREHEGTMTARQGWANGTPQLQHAWQELDGAVQAYIQHGCQTSTSIMFTIRLTLETVVKLMCHCWGINLKQQVQGSNGWSNKPLHQLLRELRDSGHLD